MKVQLFVGAVMLATTPLLAAPPASDRSTTKPADTVTVTGCVQGEADYRKTMDKGRGGTAGTGVGAGNEFVLTNATGGDAKETAYELTGANEKLAAAHVGHRVTVTGMLKPAEVSASGKPTGGATAGTPPSGVDVLSKDLQLRELEVSNIKMLSADCK